MSRAMTAPQTARNVSRGIPSQSAHADHARVSSTIVSPTSKTTARRVTGASGAVLPRNTAQRLSRKLLGLEPGPLVDLLDATQVEPVDEDGLDVRVADALITEHRDGLDDRDEHLGRSVEEPIRFRPGMEEHRADDPERG